MTSPSLWSRLKNAHLFRVLVIYAAASWVLLQIVGLFIETMDLPRWTMPWTLVLLVVGLIVVLVTTWVQSHPSMPAREAADEVPSDWEVDLGEIKEAVSKGRLPHLNWARAILGGVFAFSLLFGIAGLYVVIQDRGKSFNPAPALAETAPGIAVLPFTVQGEGLDVWREGMVSLLSTGLDGAAGLRAIDNRTVLARWDEHVPETSTADLATALEVARAARASYAVVGSAVAIGPDVRLVADAYAVDTGEQLGRASAEGSPDSVLMLVDRLAVDLLRVILQGEEQLPEINLASLTTESPEALKAYLEGEVLHRHADFAGAIEAYERAVAADSTFALAQAQLGYVYRWSGRRALGSQHVEQAARFAHRLPKREALFVRAMLDEDRRTIDSLAPLREATRLYPDDAEAWYRLGELYLHVRSASATSEEIEQAFERAVQLDPRNTLYLVHYLHFAWWLDPDSARAEERLEMFDRVDPSDQYARAGRRALDLAFGDSVAQREAMTQLRAGDSQVITNVRSFLGHPRHVAWEPVWRLVYERSDDESRSFVAQVLFARSALWYGRLRKTPAELDDPAVTPGSRAQAVYYVFAAGLPIPEARLEQALDPALIDSIAEDRAVFFVGAFAADRGRWSDHADAIAEFERRAERALGAADSTGGLLHAGWARALEGYRVWRQGQPTDALPMLEDPRAQRWVVVQLWLGRLYQELGRFQDAERVYRSYDDTMGGPTNPMIQRELGKIYEQLEEYDKARESYEYFVHYWRDADPELQPMVEEARQAIIRLKGLRRE